MADELNMNFDADTLITTATTEEQKVAIINRLVQTVVAQQATIDDHESRITTLEP